MIKADIVKKVSEELSSENNPIKDKEALAIVDTLIECLKDTVIDHERPEIRDFGVFQVKQRKARIGRNPKNKKTYPIPAHYVVTFKPGKQIKTVEATSTSGTDSDDAT